MKLRKNSFQGETALHYTAQLIKIKDKTQNIFFSGWNCVALHCTITTKWRAKGKKKAFSVFYLQQINSMEFKSKFGMLFLFVLTEEKKKHFTLTHAKIWELDKGAEYFLPQIITSTNAEWWLLNLIKLLDICLFIIGEKIKELQIQRPSHQVFSTSNTFSCNCVTIDCWE